MRDHEPGALPLLLSVVGIIAFGARLVLITIGICANPVFERDYIRLMLTGSLR